MVHSWSLYVIKLKAPSLLSCRREPYGDWEALAYPSCDGLFTTAPYTWFTAPQFPPQ